jgi:hypothetical protein
LTVGLGFWIALGTSGAGAGQPALQEMADELAARILPALEAESLDACVLALRVEGDASILGHEGRLIQQLENLMVHRLSSQPIVARVELISGHAVEQALERARGLGASWLIRCTLGTAQARLTATADLSPLGMPFWERLADPTPRGARHHLFASVTADAEIRMLLGMERALPALAGWRLEEALYLPRRVLDAGLGDLDGDGRPELVLLGEDILEVYSLAEGSPRRLASQELESIPLEATRGRDPIGSLVVVDFNRDGRSEVFYKLANRRWGELLVWNGARLEPIRKLGRVPLCLVHLARRPTVLSGLPEAGTNLFQPALEVADINASTGSPLALSGPFASLRCHQNATGRIEIRLVDARGALHRLELDGTQTLEVEKVGAGSGMADLDQDGRAELILSEAVWPGEPDGLRVLSGGPGGGEVLWRTRELIGSVVAVSGGLANGQGRTQAVIVALEPGGRASRIYLLGR